MKFECYKTCNHPELSTVSDLLISEHAQPRRKRGQFNYAMRNMVINLWQACELHEPIEISLSKKNYRPLKWFSHTHMTSIVNFLVANEYVERFRGYNAYVSKDGVRHEARRTRLEPTGKLHILMERFYGATIGYDSELAPFVFLKDADKEYVQPPNSVAYHKLERNARDIYNRLSTHIYTVASPPSPISGDVSRNENDLCFQFVLRRIFSRGRRSLTHGGRFYSRALMGGLHPQGMPQEVRKSIKIDGQATVELDYSTLHPRLAAAMAGHQLDGDVYASIDAPRDDVKLMLLIAFNAKNRLEALRAFRKDTKRWEPDVYDAIADAYPVLAPYIGSDIGILLQRKDSDITERILLHFTSQGIACIPIHDSFIVQARYEVELRTVMHEAYASVMGGFTCPVHN